MAASLSSSSSSLRRRLVVPDVPRATSAAAVSFGTHKLGKAFRSLSICNSAAAPPAAVVGGLQKACHVSDELQKIVGHSELPRNQVLKQVWAYIKENKLQNPVKKSEIVCDETMAHVFGVDKMGYMEVNGFLSNHLTYEGASGPKVSTPKAPKDKEAAAKRKVRKVAPIRARTTGRYSNGLTKPVRISDALRNFLGVAETEVPRSQVVKLVWNYIKENKLQDENDKRKVTCDSKLRGILHCDSFVGITMTTHLKPHFLKET